MPRVRLCHWRESEAAPLIDILRKAGYTVDYKGDKANGSFRTLREKPAFAVVIDLTRLHLTVAGWLLRFAPPNRSGIFLSCLWMAIRKKLSGFDRRFQMRCIRRAGGWSRR